MEKTLHHEPEREHPGMQKATIKIDFKWDPLRAVPGFGYDEIEIKPEQMNGNAPIPTHRAVPQQVLGQLAVGLFMLRQVPDFKQQAEALLKLIANHVSVDPATVSRIIVPS